MAERMQVYKCEACGNIVEVLTGGGGELVCCGEPMVLMTENTVDAAVEKHIPVLEADGSGTKVKVGSVAHPMEDVHFIEWVQIIEGDKMCRIFLKPGAAPEASILAPKSKSMTARAYCNIHGLWKS